MAMIGYPRVSTTGQSLDVQLDKLKTVGCTKIYEEKRSGLDGRRLQLKASLDYLHDGDRLAIVPILP